MNIITANKQTKLTNQLMEDVKDLLNAYFIQMDIALIPTLGVIEKVNKNQLGVREIVEVVNTSIDRSIYPSGLTTRTKKREIVMKRQIVSYICKTLGYPLEHIGKVVYSDHSTVVHSCKLVKSLLKQKDPEITKTYEDIVESLNNYHKEKYGKDLPEVIKRRDNSQSTICAVEHT